MQNESEFTVIGWREWMSLPELGIPALKVKADTGARTSALHAIDITPFSHKGDAWVNFKVPPVQRVNTPCISCAAAIVDKRIVTDSGGHGEERYVIDALLAFGDQQRRVELTLTHRAGMRFRMLLGRTALNPGLVVDSGVSYRFGRVDVRKHYAKIHR